ncbi:hypothetical protein BH09MYX1_BH09MYX1_11490 [soil metagenome]
MLRRMLRSRTLLLAPSLFVLASISCGGTPPAVTPKPVATVAKVQPPPPTRAKWIFSRPERGFVAKLEMGDDGTLYVGRNGRRTLVKNGAEPTDATTLAYENLVGVVKDDKGQFAFVAEDGDIYVATSPLGSLNTMKEGPLGDAPNAGRLSSITTGKSVVMGIAPDGRVFRTADAGASWKAIDYAGGAKTYGRVGTVALDGKGNGLLLHFPQKLFITHDDGATWAPVASPGIGAKRVYRDGKGRVFLDGVQSKRAKLDGNAITLTTESPEAVLKGALPGSPPLDERADVLTVLSGERVVEFVLRTEESKEIEVSSAKIGDKLGAPVKVPDLYSDRGLAVLVAGYGSELVYLRRDGEQEGDSTTLFRSKEYGASWTKDGTFEGIGSNSADGTEVAVGPKGWTFVTGLCQEEDGDGDDGYQGDDDDDDESDSHYGRSDSESEDTRCGHRQIKPAGAKAFEDLAFVEEFAPQSFAFDEAHDRVYAIGTHMGRTHVYESSLSQKKFVRAKVLDVDSDVHVSMSVDDKGTLRVFERDDAHDQWIVHRRGADAKDMPAVYVPGPDGTMSFAGGRGLLFGGHEKGYETGDGGENWMRVATNGFVQSLTCTVAGCLNGGAARVGWDIPVIQNADKIVAQATPQPVPTRPIPPPMVISGPALPRLGLTCKSSGAVARVAQTPSSDMVDTRSGDVRWGFVKHDPDGKTTLVLGTKTGTREVALQGPTPKDPPAPAAGAKPAPGAKAPLPAPERRAGQTTLADGMVLARYAFQSRTGAGLNPVDVELTWYSGITGKVVKKTLPQMKPFRISRYGFSGTAQIVDGGLLCHGTDDDALNFIHDDGKVEPITLPSDIGVRNAAHLGKRWIFQDSEIGNAILNVTDDSKTWSRKPWGIDAAYAPALSLFGAKAMVVATRGQLPVALFGLEGALPDDPPAAIVVDTNSADAICDAKTSRTRYSQSTYQVDKRTLKLDMETGKNWSQLLGYTRIMHVTDAGKLCTSAFTANTSDQSAFIYPESATTFSGWRFRRTADPKDKTKMVTEAEPISCAAPK